MTKEWLDSYWEMNKELDRVDSEEEFEDYEYLRNFHRHGRIMYDITSRPIFIPSSYIRNTESTIRFHKFKLLDEVFNEFIDTNYHKKKHFEFNDILKYDQKTINPRFTHANIEYVATLFVHDDADKDWLNIKLVNDGFQYILKKGIAVPKRHNNTAGWVLLNDKDWKDMDGMMTKFQSVLDIDEQVFQKATVFYNFDLERLDFKFFSSSDNYNNVIVTFEPGTPHYERFIEPQPYNVKK